MRRSVRAALLCWTYLVGCYGSIGSGPSDPYGEEPDAATPDDPDRTDAGETPPDEALCPVLEVSAPSDEPPDTLFSVSTIEGLDPLLRELAAIITTSLARTDKDAALHPAFHGCIDWHSAVHCHWALLRIARLSPDYAGVAAAADASLSAENLAGEQMPEHEVPYGAAWLLRLVIEFETWSAEAGGADPDRLRSLGDAAATALLEHYRAQPPQAFDDSTYGNGPWAAMQLRAYLVHRGDDEARGEVDGWIDAMLCAAVVPSFRDDRSNVGFFSPFGNWLYLAARTRSTTILDRLLESHPLGDEDLSSPPARADSYSWGLHWSRAWTLRALSQRVTNEADRARFDAAFLEHVTAGRGLHEEHQQDILYSHWVPQFAVHALTEGL